VGACAQGGIRPAGRGASLPLPQYRHGIVIVRRAGRVDHTRPASAPTRSPTRLLQQTWKACCPRAIMARGTTGSIGAGRSTDMAMRQAPAFGALLKRYRQAAGLTQEALAEQAGLSVRAVSDLERGLKVRPHKDTVALLTAALQPTPPEHAAFVAARQGSAPPATGAEVPPLVGRSRELVLLERHLAGEGPPLLLLAGEPGIGKTRLLHAALPRPAGHGLRVLEGGCQRRGGHEPYVPLLDALRRHIRHLAPAQQRTEPAGCAGLVHLLPEPAAGPIEPLPAW